VLSGERPESTKAKPSNPPNFFVAGCFSLAGLSTAREKMSPRRPLRLCGEKPIWTFSQWAFHGLFNRNDSLSQPAADDFGFAEVVVLHFL